MAEKAFLLKALDKAPKFISHAYAVFLIMIGWLIFYYTDTAAGLRCLGAMVGAGSFSSPVVSFTAIRALPTLLIFAVGCTPYPKQLWHKLTSKNEVGRCVNAVMPVLGLVLCLGYMVASSYSPFLYWNF